MIEWLWPAILLLAPLPWVVRRFDLKAMIRQTEQLYGELLVPVLRNVPRCTNRRLR